MKHLLCAKHLLVSFAYLNNYFGQIPRGHALKVTELHKVGSEPSFASSLFLFLHPSLPPPPDLGGVCLFREGICRPTSSDPVPLLLCQGAFLGCGWMEAPVASVGQPRTAAASLAPQESPVTVDKWSVSFSHVVLIAGLRPELSR